MAQIRNSKPKTMISLLQNFRTIILANGAFPQHKIPLSFLHNAERIICCDGSCQSLLNIGLQPDYIVGDLDSISDEIRSNFSSILHYNSDQETNDLTKAVQFCIQHNWKQITILGATGKREDHSLGNLSLLSDYAEQANVQLFTDFGVFSPQLEKKNTYESYKNQQVSIFALSSTTLFSSKNLVYQLDKRMLTSWWQGTLNESTSEFFEIEMDKGKALIFREYG
jgi:thiamine pyrophosphokinase